MRAYGKNVEKNCGQITEECGSICYLWNEQAALSEIKRQVQKPSESPYCWLYGQDAAIYGFGRFIPDETRRNQRDGGGCKKYTHVLYKCGGRL